MTGLLAALAISMLDPQETQAPAPADPSLARIRAALSTPDVLVVSEPIPMFRIRIVDRPLILGTTLTGWDFSKEPVPPGGLHAFEMRRVQGGNPWSGQPLIKFDVLPLILGGVKRTRAAYAARGARIEVEQSLQEFCAAHDCQPVAPGPPPLLPFDDPR